MEMKVNIENATPGAGDGDGRGWVLVNVKMVLGLLGAAACLGWIAITLISGPLGTGDLTMEFQSVVAHLAFLAGVAAIMGCAAPLSDTLSQHRVALLAASAALVALGVVSAYLLEDDRLFLWLGFGLSGIGAGGLYVLYGEYLSTYFSNGIEPYIRSILLIAAVWVAGYFFIDVDYRLSYWLVIAVIAFLGYVSQMVFYSVHTAPFVKWKESRARSHVRKRSYFSTTTSGIVFGFAIGAMFTIGGGGVDIDEIAFLIAALAVVAMCVLLLVDSLKKHMLSENVSMHWFLPTSAVLSFPMLFVPPSVAFIFAVLMACFAVFPTSCSISAICRHIHICGLAAIGQFGLGRFFNFIGIFVGVGLGFVGFSQQFALWWGHYGILTGICILMMLVITSCSFVMVEDNYPSDERIQVVENENGEKIVTVGPGTPIHALPANEPAAVSALEDHHVGIFQLKCDLVAEKYGLSRRQAEVLGMLARGRGAEYITEKLVISPHTAKAHTYNIYLKLDVHSRQELMDLVENTVVPDEVIEQAMQRGA